MKLKMRMTTIEVQKHTRAGRKDDISTLLEEGLVRRRDWTLVSKLWMDIEGIGLNTVTAA